MPLWIVFHEFVLWMFLSQQVQLCLTGCPKGTVYICPLPTGNFFFQFNTLSARDKKKGKFAHSIDRDEEAHNEPPHVDLHCLPSSLSILNMI